ncbi:MAG TPA: beta-ketoacyl synthase, partial [Thermoanaerobaculia bacterium]|nr:beta-ketoacyl synthase [Thermoanaerobaculia bacterium]
MRRVGIFGWGIVAPRSPHIAAFAENLASTESWLEPFNGFGPDNFLVGIPQFSFEEYRGWIAERFPPSRFHSLTEKMDLPVQYAVGSFIQALGQNPGLDQELRALGTAAHVYMGTGIGCVDTVSKQTRAL